MILQGTQKMLFCGHLPDNDPHKVEQMKEDIGSEASRAGFHYSGRGWTVAKVKEDGKTQWRVEAEFST